MEKDEKNIPLEEDTRALKEAMSFVVGKQLPIPKNWSGEDFEKLEFPNDLSKLTTDQLGEMMGVWSTVMAYAQYETARMDIEKTAYGNRYEFEKKKLYLLSIAEGNMPEEQRKAEIYVKTAKLRSDFEVVKAKYVMVNAMLNAYSIYYQALSRELARRGIAGAERPPKEDPEYEEFIDEISAGKNMITKDWHKE